MDQNKHFYDLKAEQYAEEWYSNETMLPSIKEFLGLFTTTNPLILDLGCGPGHESKRLYESGANVIGIDYSSESIKIAKQRNPSITFFEMDYFNTNSTLGCFDGIFSCSSLIHLSIEELNRVISKISIVLRTNGFILVIYRIGKGQIIQEHKINEEKIIRTIEQYEKHDLIKIFANNGFEYKIDGYLDSTLKPYWDSIVFQKK